LQVVLALQLQTSRHAHAQNRRPRVLTRGRGHLLRAATPRSSACASDRTATAAGSPPSAARMRPLDADHGRSGRSACMVGAGLQTTWFGVVSLLWFLTRLPERRVRQPERGHPTTCRCGSAPRCSVFVVMADRARPGPGHRLVVDVLDQANRRQLRQRPHAPRWRWMVLALPFVLFTPPTPRCAAIHSDRSHLRPCRLVSGFSPRAGPGLQAWPSDPLPDHRPSPWARCTAHFLRDGRHYAKKFPAIPPRRALILILIYTRPACHRVGSWAG